ncbi:MAG: lysozyme inhibitor LprI family protein [Sphingomicrobium sp.]
MQRINWTTIALIGGLVLLVLVVAYFATSRNPDQDKLTNAVVSTATAPSREKLCSSNATLDAIKRDLFRRAGQLRGGDQAAYDRLSGYAVVRMENPVMESEDASAGIVNCSGSLSVDLPPGVAAEGGRRTLTAGVDYSVDANGAVALRNADTIVGPLATLARVAEPPPEAPAQPETNEVVGEQPQASIAAPQPSNEPLPRSSAYPGRPSFDCSRARSPGETAVCSDPGLSVLDRNMAAQYGRALASASPDQNAILRDTARRFYAFRDRCSNRQCVADAYVGRMKEIRDVMEGRWEPPR